MRYRELGRTGLVCSVIGMGCGESIARLAGGADTKVAKRLINEAREQGISFFDTADIYAAGDSERILGQALGPNRKNVIVATKAGHRYREPNPIERTFKRYARRIKHIIRTRSPARGAEASGGTGRPRQSDKLGALSDYSPKYIEACIVKSLRRLGTDYIDIFQLHSPRPDIAEEVELCEYLKALRDKGYFRFLGVSCYQPEHADAFTRMTGIGSVQLAFNPRKARAANSGIASCQAANIGVIARQPVDHGRIFQNGDIKSKYRSGFETGDFASVLMRFAAHRDGVCTVLCGMGTMEHLRSNIEASSAPPLDKDESDWLLTIYSA